MEDRDDGSRLFGVEVLVRASSETLVSVEFTYEVPRERGKDSLPGGGGRTSLGFTISYNDNRDLVGTIHDGSERDGQSISELSTLVDTSRSLGLHTGYRGEPESSVRERKSEIETHVDMRRESSGPREVLDEFFETFTVERVLGVELGDGTFDVQVGEDRGS